MIDRRIFVLAVAVVTTVTALTLALTATTDARPVRVPDVAIAALGPPPTADDRDSDSDRGQLDRSTVAVPSPDDGDASRTDTLDREPHAPPAESVGDGDVRRILVLDAVTRAAVPDATVSYLPIPLAELARAEPAAFRELAATPRELHDRFGIATTTDQNGIATVAAAAVRSRRRCLAIAGSRTGTLDPAGPRSADGAYVVAIAAACDVTVRVVDRRHAPIAGIAVYSNCTTARFGDADLPFAFPHGATDADGTRTLENVEALARRWPLHANGRDWRTAIFAGVLGHGPADGVPLASTQLPRAAPVDIVLPPTGCVEVHVRTGTSATTHAAIPGAIVELAIDVPPTAAGAGDLLTIVRAPLDARGRARFAHVGLHRDLTATVRRGREATAVTAVGPVRGGTTVRIDVSLPQRRHVVTGRATDPSGTVPAAQTLHAFVDERETGGGTRRARTRTSTDGRFRLEFDGSRHDVDWRTLRFRLDDLDGNASAFGTVPMLHVETEHHLDAGDVRFTRRRRLVAGRVVTVDGEPTSGARGRVEARRPDGTWAPVPETSFVTAEDGSFDVPGTPRTRHGELRVRANAPGAVCREPVALHPAPDEGELRVVLVPAAALRVRVLHPPGRRAERLAVRCRGLDPGSAPDLDAPPVLLDEPADARTSSTHTWTERRPGAYRVTVHTVEGRELAALDVELRAGGVTDRLVDLRGAPDHPSPASVDRDGDRDTGRQRRPPPDDGQQDRLESDRRTRR